VFSISWLSSGQCVLGSSLEKIHSSKQFIIKAVVFLF